MRDSLDFDKLCHKALKILVNKRIETELYRKEKEIVFGVKREDLENELSLTKEELFVVTSILKEAKEIKVYNNDFLGYYAIQKGIYSYGDKKYLNKNQNKKRENIKYYVQVLIPIITSFIALGSILLNISQWKSSKAKSDTIMKLNKESEQVHIRLDSLEEKTKNIDSVFLVNGQNP